MMKIDPYLNVDAGTMRPYEHGEVYVTDDGFETDLDLGNYERFVRVNTTQLPASQRARSTRPSSTANAAATTSARPSRSSPISPTRSNAVSGS
jgi:hypothetical protein